MAKNPIKLAYSGLTERVYAFRRYRHAGNAIVAIGDRDDVTTDFRALMNQQITQWVKDGVLAVPNQASAAKLNEFFDLPQGETDG